MYFMSYPHLSFSLSLLTEVRNLIFKNSYQQLVYNRVQVSFSISMWYGQILNFRVNRYHGLVGNTCFRAVKSFRQESEDLLLWDSIIEHSIGWYRWPQWKFTTHIQFFYLFIYNNVYANKTNVCNFLIEISSPHYAIP